MIHPLFCDIMREMSLIFRIATIVLFVLYYALFLAAGAFFLIKNKSCDKTQVKEFERSVKKKVFYATILTVVFALLFFVFNVVIVRGITIDLSVTTSVVALVISVLWLIFSFLFIFLYLGKHYHKKFEIPRKNNQPNPFRFEEKILICLFFPIFLINLFFAAIITFLQN